MVSQSQKGLERLSCGSQTRKVDQGAALFKEPLVHLVQGMVLRNKPHVGHLEAGTGE